MRLWDVATGKMTKQFGIDQGMVSCVAYSPDGKTVAASHGDGVRLWNAATGKQLREWPGGAGAFCVAFTPDGKKVAWYVGRRIVMQPVARN